MEPRGQPNEIPINIDPNAWQIVLRDGVPTLVPRRYAEPPNLTALVRTQNGNAASQSNLAITQRAYEQGLALDYASQTTPLSEEQHQFLRDKLQALRGTIDHLANNIDARRQVTMSYENPAGMSQSASSSPANNLASTTQPQTSFTQPSQQAQNIHHRQTPNFGAQNFAAGVPRQAEASNGVRNHSQGTTTLLPHQHSTNRQPFQTNPSNMGGLSRTEAMSANAPSRSTHQRQTSAQGVADQLQKMIQQSQQPYVDLGQPTSSATSNTYQPLQSQAGSSRAIRNVSIPQQYVQNTFQPPVTNASHVQAGVPYLNTNQVDYQSQWHHTGQVNNQQTPARQYPLPQAHISPASNQNTTVRPKPQTNPAASVQTKATNPAALRSIVTPLYPQQSQGLNRPVTLVIPPAPTPTQPQPQSRATINSFSHPPTAQVRPMSATAQELSAAIQNTDSSAFRKPQPLRQPQPSVAPVIPPATWRPPAVSAPFPVPSAMIPTVPVKAPVKEEALVKEEPVEEVSLAQAILQHYGKRKMMDSAASPGPANKRRAVGTDIAGERQAVNLEAPVVPNGWTEGDQAGSTGPMDESGLVNDLYEPEGLDDFIFSETAPEILQPTVNAIVEEPRSTGDQLPGGEVPMVLTESTGVHPDTTSRAQPTGFAVDSVMEAPPNDTVDNFIRVDALSDEMNVPELSRSPSAARISDVSENSEVPRQGLVEDAANHSETEVEGAIMVDVDSNEHQLTPVPNRNTPDVPLFAPENKSPEGGEGGDKLLLRSPSIPLFQSVDNAAAGKGKKIAISRSRSPSEPLFLPMPSSSSSDVEIVEESLQKKGTTTASSFKGPRRQFLGVFPPYIPGVSSKRRFRGSRGLKNISPSTDSERGSPRGDTGTVAFTRSRMRRPRVVSSSESDSELTGLVSGTRPVFGDNGLVNDPYSVLNPMPCLWAHCDAVLDSLAKLAKHVELVHTRPALLQSELSDAIPRCRWDGCRRRTWAWCNEGGSSKFLRHVLKHIGPEMSCMIDGCAYSTKNREEFRKHCDEAHKGDQHLQLKPSTIPNIVPREPTQSLPDFAPASEALYLAVYGDSNAALRSRPPPPQATSQAMSTMPLSPTKHSPRWREIEERTSDEYSFLDPFYPPSLYMDDLSQSAMELFEAECYGSVIVEDQSTRSISDEP